MAASTAQTDPLLISNTPPATPPPQGPTEAPPLPDQTITIEYAPIVTDDRFRLGYLHNDTIENPEPLRAECPQRDWQTIYDLYDEMLRKDGHLESKFFVRFDELLACPWDVVPGGEKARDQKMALWVKDKLSAIRGFENDLRELCDALPKGFAVSEVVWTRNGSEIGIGKLMSRRQRRFRFSPEGRLLLGEHYWDWFPKPVPDRKFLVHRFMTLYEDPYGVALCSRAFWPYWFKKNAFVFWAKLCEKRAFPMPVAKYQPGTSKEQVKEILNALKRIMVETGMAIPNTVAIEWVQMMGTSPVTCYSEFVKVLDEWETKIVLHETLTTTEGKHGTNALGMVHRTTADARLTSDATAMQATINQLIEWLVDLNFASVECYPKFQIQTNPDENLDGRAARDAAITKIIGTKEIAGSYWFETYGYPKATEADPGLEGPPPPVPFGGKPGVDGSDPSNQSNQSDESNRGPAMADPAQAAAFAEAHAATNRLLELIARDVADHSSARA